MSDWLTSIAPGVANHLWQTTAFVSVVWLVTLALRKNQARIRYALWLAASVKFLLPFSLLVSLGSMLPRPHRAVTPPAIYTTVDEVVQPFPDIELTTSDIAPSAIPQPKPLLPALIASIWFCGAIAALAVWAMRWRRVWQTLRCAKLATSGREFELLQRVRRASSLRHIRLRLSQDLMEPGIFGIFRATLIWPQRLSQTLDDEHIEAILIHEFEHARRRDNLTAALHMLVEAAFWFHPLVWWMERRMIEERERACDESVVAMGSTPGVYAESLLKTVRFCVESPLTCVAGITGADLSQRVRSIMRPHLQNMGLWRKIALTVPLLAAFVGPVAFGVLRMIPVYGQVVRATGPPPSYDIVVVKPSQDSANGADTEGEQTHYKITAKMLIQFAYGTFNPGKTLDLEVVGGPDWINTDVFDILAKMDSQAWTAQQNMSRAQRREQHQFMEQSLLADRFKLKMHVETRDRPVYTLTVAKGLKLTPAKDATGGAHVNPSPGSMTPEELKRGLIVQAQGRNFVMTVKGMTLDAFSDALMRQKEANGREVVNQTGMTGAYDFTLRWGPDEATASEHGGEVEESPLFIAIQQQLGLKLAEGKGPAEVVVIDHIEKPTFDEAEVTAPTNAARVAFVQKPALAITTLAKRPEFEVATIKFANPDRNMGIGLYTYPGGRILCTSYTLHYLVMEAFGLQSWQVSGGPAWVNDTRYDVEAKPSASSAASKLDNPMMKAPPTEEQREMLQSLLMDRFQLKIHRESKEGSVYILSRGDKPLKLQPPKDKDEFSWAGSPEGGLPDGSGMRGTNISMEQLAKRLSGFLKIPVVDRTDLAGSYDFEYKTGWDDANTDVSSAIIESMKGIGLSLKSGKAPVEVLVIDHAEGPSAN